MYSIKEKDYYCWDWCCYTLYEYLYYNNKRLVEVTWWTSEEWVNFINKTLEWKENENHKLKHDTTVKTEQPNTK